MPSDVPSLATELSDANHILHYVQYNGTYLIRDFVCLSPEMAETEENHLPQLPPLNCSEATLASGLLRPCPLCATLCLSFMWRPFIETQL